MPIQKTEEWKAYRKNRLMTAGVHSRLNSHRCAGDEEEDAGGDLSRQQLRTREGWSEVGTRCWMRPMRAEEKNGGRVSR